MSRSSWDVVEEVPWECEEESVGGSYVNRLCGIPQPVPEHLTAINLSATAIAKHPPGAVKLLVERVVKRLWPVLEGV